MATEIPFGSWLRQRRRILDLTQQELADQAGCARITLRRIESGALKPSKELAQILLEKVGIPAQEQESWIGFTRGLSASPPEFHPDGTHQGHPTNLPAALTTFIGREKELAEVASLTKKHRLATLIGSGGVGKTRLSLKVGEMVLNDYTDGVWLVELAALNEPEFLPQTVAAVFGIPSSSSTSPMESLLHFLKPKTVLLILDNCEHLLDACARLVDTLLKNCPHLKILGTSREALGMLGEASYRVPSLGVPDLQLLLGKIQECESVRLFEERAALVQTDFLLTVDNALSIAQICQRLDGIPLAIELAAVQVNTLSPAEIAAQIDDCFHILTSGNRAALPRQQTIRASIDWSWDLLSDAERVFLRRLSVFAGGWTLESAHAISDGDIQGLTNALVRKSLIVVDQEAMCEKRYRFHEIVRQYLRDRLSEAGEEEIFRTRHLGYFLQLSELAEPNLKGPLQAEWLSRLNTERDNLYAAMEWAGATNIEAGLYLAGRLHRFWENYGLREGEHWLAEFVQKPEAKNHPYAKANALLTRGWLLCWLGNPAIAHLAAEECLGLFQANHDIKGEIDALTLLANTTGKEADKELLQQALLQAQALGDLWRQGRILSRLGWVDDNYQNRSSSWRQAISLFRETGDIELLSTYLGALGSFELSNGNIESAREMLDEAIKYPINVKIGRRNYLAALGRIESMRGDFEKARSFLEEGMNTTEEYGDRDEYLSYRTHLGYLYLRQGKISEARVTFDEIVQEHYQVKNRKGITFALEGLASLCVVIGNLKRAARLIGWADAWRKETGDRRPLLEQADVDKIIQACMVQMGEAVFAEAYGAGQKMSIEQAVTSALEEE
jgi:predicted ATPase/DNA-binding XRE family transcriptional regulator